METPKFEFKGNEFLNPDDCPYEIAGFFEEIFDAEFGNFLGVRRLSEPDRPLGHAGRKEFAITEDVILVKGTKDKLYRASRKKPLKVVGMLQIVCGRTKEN